NLTTENYSPVKTERKKLSFDSFFTFISSSWERLFSRLFWLQPFLVRPLFSQRPFLFWQKPRVFQALSFSSHHPGTVWQLLQLYTSFHPAFWAFSPSFYQT